MVSRRKVAKKVKLHARCSLGWTIREYHLTDDDHLRVKMNKRRKARSTSLLFNRKNMVVKRLTMTGFSHCVLYVPLYVWSVWRKGNACKKNESIVRKRVMSENKTVQSELQKVTEAIKKWETKTWRLWILRRYEIFSAQQSYKQKSYKHPIYSAINGGCNMFSKIMLK